MPLINLIPDVSSPTLADIIQDFLEVTCKLAETEQTYLVKELAQGAVSSEAIEVHPAFSVDGRIIVVGNTPALECWLYSPKAGKIFKAKWTSA